jgi:hypothetical protein
MYNLYQTMIHIVKSSKYFKRSKALLEAEYLIKSAWNTYLKDYEFIDMIMAQPINESTFKGIRWACSLQ